MALTPEARRAAQRHGRKVNRVAAQYTNPVTGKPLSGKALLAKLFQGESGGRNNAVSYAGARGVGQFMPGTRRAVIQATGGKVDPWKSADDAAEAAVLHLTGKLGHRKGLEGYNPGGGQDYVKYILGQKVGDVGGGKASPSTGGSRSGSGGRVVARTTTVPGVDRSAERQALKLDYLQERGKPGALLSLATGLQAAKDTPAQRKTSYAIQGGENRSQKLKPRLNTGPEGKRYAGTEARIIPLSQRAHALGLKTTSGKRGTVNTASGGVSDHYSGNKSATARDWSGPPQKMDRLARSIAKDLGVKDFKGGVLNVNRGGYRYQLLWKTNVGGNHFDHVHLGIKKL